MGANSSKLRYEYTYDPDPFYDDQQAWRSRGKGNKRWNQADNASRPPGSNFRTPRRFRTPNQQPLQPPDPTIMHQMYLQQALQQLPAQQYMLSTQGQGAQAAQIPQPAPQLQPQFQYSIPMPMPQPGVMPSVAPAIIPSVAANAAPLRPGPIPAIPFQGQANPSYMSVPPPPIAIPPPAPVPAPVINQPAFNFPINPLSIPPPMANLYNHDPLRSNPLPVPPREARLPTPLESTASIDDSDTDTLPSALPNPLPRAPRDVYASSKYRELLEDHPEPYLRRRRSAERVGVYENVVRPVLYNGEEDYEDNEEEEPEGSGMSHHVDAGNTPLPSFARRLRPFKPPPTRAPIQICQERPEHRRHVSMPSPNPAPIATADPVHITRPGSADGSHSRHGAEIMYDPTDSSSDDESFLDVSVPSTPGPTGERGGKASFAKSIFGRPPFRRNNTEPGETHHKREPSGDYYSTVISPSKYVGDGGTADSSPPPVPPTTKYDKIRFDIQTPIYNALTHLSSHSVAYHGKLYPSAAHLLEAHKYLGGRQESLAKRVRHARDLVELNALASSFQKYVREDWEAIMLAKMEDVLFRKFMQHPNLSDLLLGTGMAELIYAEEADSFWGTGPHGQGENHLGRILMHVRNRLKRAKR